MKILLAILSVIKYLWYIVLLWIAVTCSINRFKNPQLTETQLLLRIPQACILNFEK